MKEQEQNLTNGPIELDLFTPEQLADHAMAAEAEEAASAAETGKTQEKADVELRTTAPQGVGSNVRKKKKKKKKKAAQAESTRPKTFVEQINEFLNEDEDTPIRINFYGLVGGDGLPGFFKRNWAFISIIVFFTCIYVTCRYMMQGAVLEHDKLTERLIDSRYKTLTLDSELLERTLSSHIEKQLKDSTIHTPTEQSYPLPME